MTYRIGVDIGGSFTDFAVLDNHSGHIHTLKVFSRPDRPGSEITTGLARLEERFGINAQQVDYFTHGTTVGINTVIQRNGVRLALLTTAGFEDVLELARLKMAHIHDLNARRPAPLIERHHVFSVQERTSSDGRILIEVDRDSVVSAVTRAREQGCDGIVVALLHAWRNDHNECRVRDIIHDIDPELLVSCSGAIWPVIREYERTITATINAYVQPRVIDYLQAFEKALTDAGVPVPPRITKSNGGVMSLDQAKAECIQMVLSGTASGVIGASYIAEQCNFNRLLSLDIGGTSADVAVIIDGQPEYGTGELIGEFNIYIPSVSVTSIGQGGGSIAWLDPLGVLQVGPMSAGSLPGPVCYNRGGNQPTVTDAFAVCGLIGHGDLGYKSVQVDVTAASRAMATLAAPLGITIEETAETIIRIAISGMYADTSALVSRFGIDPREYYFLAFGGAGPMMGCWLARELNMKGVVIPPTPGVLSALGGLVADLRNDFIDTLYSELSMQMLPWLRERADTLRVRGEHWLTSEHGTDLPYTLMFLADMRYRGQSFEVEVTLDKRWLETGDLDAICQAFHARHEQIFNHHDPQATIQIINLRLVVTSPTNTPPLKRLPTSNISACAETHVQAYIDGQWRSVAFYQRHTLYAGQQFASPAIIAQDDCTTCVPTGMQITVDDFGNLIVTADTSQEDTFHGH
ncbi:hydantoinase/oxoprolinase family protein [Phytohalomonas tamaricis]|uniref:hydantoinase/oxoprolinase family protein n=1 Tax=Phytohalomonas tamaricis TaxID=2081032 RepID=UPI000D0B8AE6|nr:hydantoinase/oxoprolinase family protein [Phytohalomonas tamaricis]